MKLIAGNWKMFKGPAETLAFFDGFEAPDGVEVVLCPPFVSLEAAVGEEWPIYAQNVPWAADGAFTGEVSAAMLVEVGVQGALVGHSERRQYFGEHHAQQGDGRYRQRQPLGTQAGAHQLTQPAAGTRVGDGAHCTASGAPDLHRNSARASRRSISTRQPGT